MPGETKVISWGVTIQWPESISRNVSGTHPEHIVKKIYKMRDYVKHRK
jgi:hypothetical protein